MGKTSKWIKKLLTGKKVKDTGGNTSNEDTSFSNEAAATPIVVPPNTPKEKRRWSFRRSTAASKDDSSMDSITMTPRAVMQQSTLGSHKEEKQQHSLIVNVGIKKHTGMAVAAANAPASVIRPTAASNRRSTALQYAAATMIQAVFRSYLARKALCALRGLVKLQALVRGHLVRKQAVTTLRCMQALLNVQARTRAKRIQMAEEAQLHSQSQRASNYRSSPQRNHVCKTSNMDRHRVDNIKIVEMDLGESRGSARSRNNYSPHNHVEREDQSYSPNHYEHLNNDHRHWMAPAPSALTDMSPEACSGHFDDYSSSTEHSSPHCYSTVSKQDPLRVPPSSPRPVGDTMSTEHTFFPNYMANTESFRAKARSQSAPKQRTDLLERQLSRKKGALDGRHATRLVRMQRSSSHVGSNAQGIQFPWSTKLERSTISLQDSECGSTSTVLTASNYCRSLAANEMTNY